MLTHDCGQRPPYRAAGQTGSGCGGLVGALSPHARATSALVAADLDAQQGGSPPERFVSEVPGDGIPGATLATTPPTPSIIINNITLQHSVLIGDVLPGHSKTEFVQRTKRRHVRGGTDSIGHVKVFLLGGMVTPIIERP